MGVGADSVHIGPTGFTNILYPPNSFKRSLVKLEESLPEDEEQSKIKETRAIGSVRSALKEVSSANTGV